jgi:hypothetical protein
MHRFNIFLKLGLVIIGIVLFTSLGCAVKKNPWAARHTKASRVNASELGRNKYYFSVNYQKRLTKSVKRK